MHTPEMLTTFPKKSFTLVRPNIYQTDPKFYKTAWQFLQL